MGLGVLVCIALLVHFSHTLFGFGRPGADFLIEEWVYDFVMLAAAAAVVARAVLRPKNRVAWGLVAAGLVSWTASDVTWSLVYAKDEVQPFPSVCDAGYVVGYVLVLAGVAALVRGRVRQMSALVWADVAVAALLVSAIGTALLMDFVLENTTGSVLETSVAVAYPVLDLATLTVAVAALALTGLRPGLPLGVVAIGVALLAVGDAVYTYQSLAETYEAFSWNNSLWPLGTTLIAVAALLPDAPRLTAARPESWRSFAVPAIFALPILTLLVLGQEHETRRLVELMTAATVIAIVVRLGLTFRENRRLVDELKQDALTRLGNRSRLLVDLRRVFEAPRPEPHMLVVLDLDGFKSYNDAFGHGAGDSLLVRLAGRLGGAVNGKGTAYRLGGDEFAVLARGDTDQTAPLVAACNVAMSERGEGFHVTSSLGAAEIPREADSRGNALELADRRMYESKDSRRPVAGGEAEAVLVGMLKQRAPELGEHGETVAGLTARVGEQMGLTESEATALSQAAELHDIGKMAIPDAILHKPAPLDEHEWEFMRQHTILGERILAAAPSLAAVGNIVRSTHERWDGRGYPDGLAGEEIPLAARIVFACDAYDAIVAARPYSQAESHEFALAELRRNAETMFDPRVVEAFCTAFARPPADQPEPAASRASTRSV